MDKLAEELCSTLNDFMTCDHMPHLVFLPINALMLMMAIAFMEYWSNSNKVLVQLISLTPPPPPFHPALLCSTHYVAGKLAIIPAWQRHVSY